MADKTTSWILKLVDQVTGPMRQVTDSTTAASRSAEELTGRIEVLEKNSAHYTKRLGQMAIAGAALAVGVNQVMDWSNAISDQQRATENLFEYTSAGARRSAQELNAIFSQSMAISEAWSQDFNEVQSAANNLLSHLGGNADVVFDQINKGFAVGANASGEFLDMLKEYPAQFKSVGLDAGQAIALISQQVKSGIWSDKGIDAIKEAGISIREMTPNTAKAIEGLGLSTVAMQSRLQSGATTVFEEIQRITGAMESANIQAQQTAIADIFRGAGEDAGINYLLSLSKANLSLEEMYQKSSALNKVKLQEVQILEQINAKQLELVQTVAPGVKSLNVAMLEFKLNVWETIVPVTRFFVEFIRNNPVLSKTIGIIGLGVTGLFSLSWIVQLVSARLKIMQAQLLLSAGATGTYSASTAVGTATTGGFNKALVLSGWSAIKAGARFLWAGAVGIAGYVVSLVSATAAQMGLNVAMSANPIGLIVLGVAALIGVIALVIKKYDEWGASLTLAMGPLGFIINLIQSFRRHWDSIVDAFNNDGILGGLKRIGLVVIDALLMPVQQLLELASKIPGLGDLAASGAQKIQSIRTRLLGPETKEEVSVKKEKSKSNGLDLGISNSLEAKAVVANLEPVSSELSASKGATRGNTNVRQEIQMNLSFSLPENWRAELDQITKEVAERLTGAIKDAGGSVAYA